MADGGSTFLKVWAALAVTLVSVGLYADEGILPAELAAAIGDEPSEIAADVEGNPESPDASLQGASMPNIKPLGSIRLVRDMTSKAGKLKIPRDSVRVYEPTELQLDSTELTPWIFYPHPTPRYPITYNPLYFEDPNLERCGNACGVFTDAVSIVHFGGRIPLLPYLMATNCPDSKVRALPDCPACREYDCEAYIPQPTILPVTVQGLAVVGLIFIIP